MPSLLVSASFYALNLPLFTSQHPKVSAVALRLQSTLGPPLLAKKASNCALVKWTRTSWSRPGRDLAPKTLQNDPRLEFYRFLMDFTSLWDRFCLIFSRCLTWFCINVGPCLNKSAWTCFVIFPKTQTPFYIIWFSICSRHGEHVL